MATLTVWSFGDAKDARIALTRIESAAQQGVLTLDDAAIVSWPTGKKRPRTQQLHSMVGAGAVGGAFWGMLFGLIFLAPLAGLAVGAAAGGLGGAFVDVGIDDEFIEQVRERVTPGTSALFLLAEDVVMDKVRDVFDGMDVELLHTNLTDAQEQELRAQFTLVD